GTHLRLRPANNTLNSLVDSIKLLFSAKNLSWFDKYLMDNNDRQRRTVRLPFIVNMRVDAFTQDSTDLHELCDNCKSRKRSTKTDQHSGGRRIYKKKDTKEDILKANKDNENPKTVEEVRKPHRDTMKEREDSRGDGQVAPSVDVAQELEEGDQIDSCDNNCKLPDEISIMFSVYAEKMNLIESTKEFNWKNRRNIARRRRRCIRYYLQDASNHQNTGASER
ncbi:hypothetical protein L9F63_001038, partial [Diploptera punctata]